MSITFNNQVYGSGFSGEDDGAPSTAFGIDNASNNPITVNGTVTKVGDPVTVTGLLPGSSDSGNTNTTNTLYVTSFDNPTMIEFSSDPPGSQTANSYRYVLSNTTLSNRQRVTFNTETSGPTQYQVVCFTTGTRILTARGQVPVEDLRPGDIAVTASGGRRPIVWIGHRDLDGEGSVLAHDQQPILVREAAFGRDAAGDPVPSRDLRLSPGHPVLVGADDGEGGVLVPVMCLINGTSIKREPATAVTYWHVELDAHDILLAEGLAAESYLDWGDRVFFSEGDAHALQNPDFVVPGLRGRCRPVATDGAVVENERVRLDALFAAEIAGHSAWASTEAWSA